MPTNIVFSFKQNVKINIVIKTFCQNKMLHTNNEKEERNNC